MQHTLLLSSQAPVQQHLTSGPGFGTTHAVQQRVHEYQTAPTSALPALERARKDRQSMNPTVQLVTLRMAPGIRVSKGAA